MQKDELNLILEDLYSWNPKLKNKESEIIKLIELMANAKPDTKFDENFAEALKKDLLSHRILLDSDDGLKENNFLFNLKNMNKKIYLVTGAMAVGVIAILAVVLNNVPNNQLSFVDNNQDQFVKAGPKAFGSLAMLSSGVAGGANQSQELSAVSSRTTASTGAVAPTLATGMGGGGSDMAMSSKMIAPMMSFTYVYKGDPIELTENTGTVYRRLKGDGNLSNNLDSLINTKSFGPLNLGSFSNLQTSYLSLQEEKRLGMSINIDFREENIYIGQNWTQWRSDRDNCGSDQACWDSYRVKINDIPEDSVVLSKATNFLNEKGINLSHYGEAKIDNNWRINYEASTDKTNYYIPEEVSAVYPLVVDGQTVYDQSGNLDGLRVSYNLIQKAVSGVSNLTSYRYETSDYELETDSTKVVSLAEKGGYGSGIYYYSETQDKVTLELGTPTKSLIRFNRYANNVNEELLIPALIFPVTNAPENYYGSRFITVPLAKQMITELTDSSNGNSGDGIIMPMVR